MDDLKSKNAVASAIMVKNERIRNVISSFVEDKPVLAPSQERLKLYKGGMVTSGKEAWAFNPQVNDWVPPMYSTDKNACQLFMGEFKECGFLTAFVRIVIQMIGAGVLVAEEEGDTDQERAEKLCHNMGMLMMVNAPVLTKAAYQLICKIVEQDDEEKDQG